MAIIKASNRFNVVTTANNGDTLELGPASAGVFMGTFEVQFACSVDFQGSFQVLGKMMGIAAATMPFVPIPYRRVNINALVSDFLIVGDPVIPSAIIRVPIGTMSLGLLVICTAGTCQIASMDMQGPSAP